MLLFKQDQQQQEGLVDLKTANLSFLRMAALLQRMNIANYDFMLWLTQPELQGLDPHHLPDSPELKQRVAYECKINPWYYFREVVKIPASGGDPIPYELSRANLALMWCFFNSVNTFLTIPRQNGKTLCSIGIVSWLYGLAGRNLTVGLFAKDNSLVQDNVSRLKDILHTLPDYLVRKSTADTDNKEGLSYAALNNTYKTWSAALDPIGAAKQGRGATMVLEQWDEFAYYKYNDITYPTATSATDTGAQLARDNGIPAANIITTTAGMLSIPAGAYAYGIKSNCLRFSETLYDCQDYAELKRRLETGSKNQMVYMEFSYKQLGKSEEWFRRVTRDKNEIQIATDYLNQWQLGTGTSVVPTHLLKKIEASLVDPAYVQTLEDFSLKWYKPKAYFELPEAKNLPYILGMDVSDNAGKDFTTLVITDPTDLSVVATGRSNLINLMDIVRAVHELLLKLPQSILIIERNRNGALFLDILIDMMLKERINPLYRLYNTWLQDYDGQTDLTNLNYSDGAVRRHCGFATTSSSREQLYSSVLISQLNYMAEQLHDFDLADEIKMLSIRNGRIDHPPDCHDDLCMAFMFTGYFALFGRNHRMYGINSTVMLSQLQQDGKRLDPATSQQQQYFAQRLRELKALLQQTNNDVLKASYQREIRYLEQQYDPQYDSQELVTATQVQQKAKEATTVDFSSPIFAGGLFF